MINENAKNRYDLIQMFLNNEKQRESHLGYINIANHRMILLKNDPETTYLVPYGVVPEADEFRTKRSRIFFVRNFRARQYIISGSYPICVLDGTISVLGSIYVLLCLSEQLESYFRTRSLHNMTI